MQAKSNQHFDIPASSVCLDSLGLFLLWEMSQWLALMWKRLCGPPWL